ncbi:MAG: hypothetical protein ABR878_11510 [Roseiarcus sp.]|jgi:hypothetical protein
MSDSSIGDGNRLKIVVGSGWWCDGSRAPWTIGAPATRSPAFFDLWLRQVHRCLRPLKVVVTDSAAPIKPDYRSDASLVWIELDRNYGHANDLARALIKTKYCGFTRSVMNGAMYALCCDADFYVYVEQDCLLYGEDLLAHAIGEATEDILIGARTENGVGLRGTVAVPMFQQSLVIVRRPALERFIIGLVGAPWSDGQVSPEVTMERRLAPFGILRIPFGRSRPIDFGLSHFYAQHLTENELSSALQLLQTSLSAGQELCAP